MRSLGIIFLTEVYIMMKQSSNQLLELLSEPEISVPELFDNPDILPKIKSRLQLFVDFLLRNSQFTKQMIGLGIKAPMHKNENMKKVAYVASDILTCDQDIIADIFVQSSKQRIRLYSEDQEFICEQIITDGETGELVIADKREDEDDEPSDAFTRKYVYLLDMLDYLNQNERDENCVNYLAKVLNTVIRVKPVQAFQFFREKQQVLDIIIKEAAEHPSLALTLVRLVHELEQKQYREEKTLIVRKIIGRLKENIQSPQATQSFLEFVEEIFSKNKFRGEEIDQLKLISQPLVDRDVIDWMINTLKQAYTDHKYNIVANCTLYLLRVVDRMNVDDEEDPYSYTQVENQTPTMDFQTQNLFNSFEQLVQMTNEITHEHYVKTTVLDFLDLILGIIRNRRFSQVKFDRAKCLQVLLKVYLRESRNSSGIIKNRIITLIEKLTDSKLVPTSELRQLEKGILKIQVNAENKCFGEKLSILLLHQGSKVSSTLHQTYEKYRGILGPTDFIQKRDKNIDQLKFAHHNPLLETQSQKKQDQQQPPNMILDELELSYDGAGFTKNKESQNSSPGVNLKINAKIDLSKLDLKVREAKIKKSKSKECLAEQNGQKKQIDPEKNNEDAQEKEITIKCGPLKKEQVDYFTKHLILF